MAAMVTVLDPHTAVAVEVMAAESAGVVATKMDPVVASELHPAVLCATTL